MKNQTGPSKPGFSTAPVFFTSISTILGAILFLRLGYATGMLGFWGVLGIILLGHTITIPTALAISELATNTRVEGGGEYFIISRSFGLNLGSTIGITLFLSQSISIAFYIIAFAEAFQPFFDWWSTRFGFDLPRQVVSIPTLLIMAWLMLFRGTGSGVRMLYIICGVLFVSLLCFFFGNAIEPGEDLARTPGNNFGFFNGDQFFILFAICFPAFTGMTAGVGLSGDLRNPSKSIPLGTMGGTLTGLIVYILVIWKLSVSASQADLLEEQLIMSRIALWGPVIIPLGLAASTLSSAMGSMLVGPRTLQAIAHDNTFPIPRINEFLAKGKGSNNEPFNASLVSFGIAFVFILLGDVNSVAEIISMFFLITYGTLCLSSFLNHFGAPPSYRPRFRSKWYISLLGFILSVWVMFMISPLYTFIAYLILIGIYLIVEHNNKQEKGLVNIFKGALFQLNRQLQVYMQKHSSSVEEDEWRPAVVCISSHSFDRYKVLDLMRWLSYQHGFGTYFHYIEGYYSKQTYTESREILERLIDIQREKDSTLYIDTMISPSYTSAIAQVIQTPSISGMENNMVMFEYDKKYPEELGRIIDNINLVRAGKFDVCIFAGAEHPIYPKNGIHVWIRDTDLQNTNLMILLGYIMLAHPDWKNGHIKIFVTTRSENKDIIVEELKERIVTGRLPITMANIEIVEIPENQTFSEAVNIRSKQAGLTLIGFREEVTKHEGAEFFKRFDEMDNILFVNASEAKEIN